MNKSIGNNDPIHMNFMSRFIFTYDFRIPIIMFLISLIVFIIRRSKRSGITFTLSIVSLSYTVMFVYMIAETIGHILVYYVNINKNLQYFGGFFDTLLCFNSSVRK